MGRLARRRRPDVVADAAARAARPLRLALQVALGVRGLAGPARRARRAGRARPRSSTSASARRSGSRTGRAFAGRGAVADQVRFDREWARAARLRRRARRAADRRRADLRRGRLGRPPRASRAVPRRRRRRHAARRLHRQGPAVGQPALRLAGAAAARLPLVDRAARAHVRALRPRADRPLPRLRRLLGGAEGRAARARRALAARAGPRAVRRRARGARRAAADRRGPRRDHARGRRGCATRSGCPAWSCSSSASTPATRRASTTSRNHTEDRVAYTGTHDNDTLRGWYESLPARARARWSTRARPRRATPTSGGT